MVVIVTQDIKTFKDGGTKTIYCSIRGLERLNALDPNRYQQVKTKLGLAVAPYPARSHLWRRQPRRSSGSSPRTSG